MMISKPDVEMDQAESTYFSMLSILYHLIWWFLKQSNSSEKIIATWELFCKGFEEEDIYALCERTSYPEAKGISIKAALNAAANGQFALISEGRYLFNHKALIEAFFSILNGTDGVNILSDYLEENNYINEDGLALNKFKKDDKLVVLGNYSYLYKNVEYNPETQTAKG